MPTPIIYPPTVDGLQKTLDASLLTGVTASATLNNVTSIQNLKGLMIIDRLDGNNILTPDKREYISFTGTSGSTVVTLVRGLGGSTDQDHAVGAIVEFVNDVVQQQAIIDGLLNTTTTAGALDTTKVVDLTTAQTLINKTLTSPKINEDVALTATSTQLNNIIGSSKSGSFTRDQTLSTDQVITGIGFKPTSIIFIAGSSNGMTYYNSWGMDDGTTPVSNSIKTGNISVGAYSIFSGDGASWGVDAKIKTFDTDGFTLDWTLTATPPAGTMAINYMAFR